MLTGYLSIGKLHILAGMPGTGKTTIALDMAATISLGRPLPDGTISPQGNVLLWSGEDDVMDTLVPRLIAAGADRKKIYFIDNVYEADAIEPRGFNPATDIPKLIEKIKEIGQVSLIIIDPIIHAVTGNSNSNIDVRKALKPLIDLAKELNVAIIGITHFTKGTAEQNPIDRVTGSLAFGAAARIVMVTSEDTTTPNSSRYIFARAKSNIGLLGGGYYYEIQKIELSNYPGVTTSKIKWLHEAIGSAQELLSKSKNNQSDALEEAKDFLSSLLSDGDIKAIDVHAAANQNGISVRTLHRAKKELQIKSYKLMTNGVAVWWWSFDSKIATQAQDCHT